MDFDGGLGILTVGSSSPEMWVARRRRCLAFMVSGGRPSARGEGRGKRDLSENVGRLLFLTWEESGESHEFLT